MIEFLSGIVVAGLIGRWFYCRKEREFRNTVIAIAEGKAEPDENGNVGWGLGV